MKKVLIVIDMQNDFIDGPLGSDAARKIVPKVIEKIESWDGELILTKDSHAEDYLYSNEGKHLPIPHCIEGTAGYKINPYVKEAAWKFADNNRDLRMRFRHKFTFGDYEMPNIIEEKPERIEIIGLDTDVCIISNALILKAKYPEADIVVDAACCAGTTKELHEAALKVMKSCQIEIENWSENGEEKD